MSGPTFDAPDGSHPLLADVMEAWWDGDPIVLRAPTPEDVRLWAATSHDDELTNLVSLMASYPSFDPPLPPEQQRLALLALLTGSTSEQVAFDIALSLKVANDVRRAVIEFLAVAIEARTQVTAHDRIVALLSYLLDNAEAGPAAIEALQSRGDDQSVRLLAQELGVDPERRG